MNLVRTGMTGKSLTFCKPILHVTHAWPSVTEKLFEHSRFQRQQKSFNIWPQTLLISFVLPQNITAIGHQCTRELNTSQKDLLHCLMFPFDIPETRAPSLWCKNAVLPLDDRLHIVISHLNKHNLKLNVTTASVCRSSSDSQSIITHRLLPVKQQKWSIGVKTCQFVIVWILKEDQRFLWVAGGQTVELIKEQFIDINYEWITNVLYW